MINILYEKKVAVNIKISVKEKRKLQDLANINTDGDVTALIKLLANGMDIRK